ncbi:MAG TPA: PEGA domain-containing protein [Kofleriaceae bacterium]
MRAFATAAIVAALAGVAAAEPKRTITIDTEPPGAQIYFNDKESGSVCTTPCSIRAPIGSYPILVEADKYRPFVDTLDVPAHGGTGKYHYKLELAVGNIVVDGPRGATIFIDDEEKGHAPATIPVEAAPHVVVIKLGGRQIYADSIDVEAGTDTPISPPKGAAGPGVATIGEEPDNGTDDTGNPLGVEKTGPKPASPPRDGAYASLALRMDVAFRKFSYKGAPTLSGFDESGHVAIGPAFEVYPGVILGMHSLRGLALYGRFEFNANSQTVTSMNSTTSATTHVSIIEIAVRHRWTFPNIATVEANGGFLRDALTFAGPSSEVSQLPDAVYSSIKFGARGSLLLGYVEPYLEIENRVVVSGGPIQDRWSEASPSGIHAEIGAERKLYAGLLVRLELGITRYGWSFKQDDAMAPQASGGSDLIKLIAFTVGYAY